MVSQPHLCSQTWQRRWKKTWKDRRCSEKSRKHIWQNSQIICTPGINKWEAVKTQYVRGALWDIGIVFRSSLYRFTVFGACTYDMVLHKSEICIEVQLSVFMIDGWYYRFLLNAGHVWRTSRDLFLRVHSWSSTRVKPCGHLFTRRVSLRVSLWDWRGLVKKEQVHNQSKQK